MDWLWCRAAVLQAGIALLAEAHEPLVHRAPARLKRAPQTAATLPPASRTRRTITARPKGVVRAACGRSSGSASGSW